VPKLGSNGLPPSSGQKIFIYQNTRYHNPEDTFLQSPSCEPQNWNKFIYFETFFWIFSHSLLFHCEVMYLCQYATVGKRCVFTVVSSGLWFPIVVGGYSRSKEYTASIVRDMRAWNWRRYIFPQSRYKITPSSNPECFNLNNYRCENLKLRYCIIIKHEKVNKKWIYVKCGQRRSQWPRGLRDEPSSPASTMGLWVRIPLEAWMSVCAFILCVGSGIATGLIPVQGVLPTVCVGLRHWKSGQGPQGL
jgi:hypothetical protein